MGTLAARRAHYRRSGAAGATLWAIVSTLLLSFLTLFQGASGVGGVSIDRDPRVIREKTDW